MDVNSIPILPDSWKNIQPDTVYITGKGRLVSFGKNQIELGQKYDVKNKHLKAIEKGEVSPKGNMGLVLHSLFSRNQNQTLMETR
ncbi:hypothetical protein [Spirulina sp. 06S082]|uniref:hypothetical protein n=1 Tax=Spirulina sp. 06S082 TaxID=3110248 RepID=UPI002B220E38|nr:hypothetical protein [Spirulina sp. 06S082]MEA5468445.1 hypothetical protein [Spirulina sp. 06S082]